MRIPPSRRPSASFFGLIIISIGAVLLMVAERPEFRPQPGQDVTGPGRTVAALGQGSTAVGAAILGTRAVAFMRRHGRDGRSNAHERPVEGGPDAHGRAPGPRRHDPDAQDAQSSQDGVEAQAARRPS